MRWPQAKIEINENSHKNYLEKSRAWTKPCRFLQIAQLCLATCSLLFYVVNSDCKFRTG